MPFSSGSEDCRGRLSLPSDISEALTQSSTSVNTNNTANSSLLSKSLKVDVEKLPVMTSMVTSKNHPSLMFKRSGANQNRKRYSASAIDSNKKKCPRYISADQRKTAATTLNKSIPAAKELRLHPNLFNSFRITKPKSNNSNAKCDSSGTKCNESKSTAVSSIHFETQSFYKFSDKSNSLAVNKQSDLITPTSVPSPTVFSDKTESSNERVSSNLNLVELDSDLLHSKEGSQEAPCDTCPSSSSSSSSSVAVTPDTSDNAVFALPNPKKIRFPAVPNSSAIQCKWEGCGECFKNHGNLSDHIKVGCVTKADAEIFAKNVKIFSLYYPLSN